MEHPDLTFRLLEQITDKFSEERKLGQGAYGTVYRGVHKNGEEIAVKMLRDKDPGLDDARFEDEVHKLKILSHPNIVQLIGYCYETHHEYIEHKGVPVLAEKIYRALCFEYLHKGSLQDHLSDECHGIDWHTRYNIIKGTCEGLKYLHMGLKNPIYHLDLKPGNILLDSNMVPKLADFGLSKVLEKTRSTEGIHGTLGYVPPEYVGNNIRSTKFDIFSLGVVILEIIAGPTARTRIGHMPPQEFTSQLQVNWKIRLQKAWSGSSLEAYCQQVNACIDIAMKCMESDKDKRPHIANVVHQLNEIENESGKGQIDVHTRITASQFTAFTGGNQNSHVLAWIRRKAKFCVNKIFFNNRKEQVGAPNGFMRSESSMQSYDKDIELGGSPHIFTYEELEEATDGFSDSRELGDGGFGTVYKGKLRDGRVVAVKRLYKNNYKRVEQFINEVDILSRLLHQNLVILYGCTSCSSRDLMLVYEYVPNGTVADHLHGPRASEQGLTWPVRMNIAIETAEALAYLHAVEIIHRDVKTNNILLDNSFHAKVADFGLSRLYPLGVTHVSTAPQGTPGYLDPVYHQCYKLTDKSDVYSFGVVLVELISSEPAVDMCRSHSEINLANMALNRIQNHEVEQLVDPGLGYEIDDKTKIMIDLVAEVAFQCLQLERNLRPSMKEVVDALYCIKNSVQYSPDSIIHRFYSQSTTHSAAANSSG